MAVVAIDTAGNVSGMFASCRHAVMAGAASTYDLRVVDRGDWNKRDRAVTVFANIACLYVGRALADRCSAIMATETVAENAGVVEIRREPARRIVTVLALIPG